MGLLPSGLTISPPPVVAREAARVGSEGRTSVSRLVATTTLRTGIDDGKGALRRRDRHRARGEVGGDRADA